MDPAAFMALMIPIVALVIPIVAIWTGHQRKMMEMRLMLQQGTQQKSSVETDTLRQDFYTLRESLTAHAMSVDENMKALAARMSSVESRVQDSQRAQDVSGRSE